jgi:hypothetical protein
MSQLRNLSSYIVVTNLLRCPMTHMLDFLSKLSACYGKLTLSYHEAALIQISKESDPDRTGCVLFVGSGSSPFILKLYFE